MDEPNQGSFSKNEGIIFQYPKKSKGDLLPHPPSSTYAPDNQVCYRRM